MISRAIYEEITLAIQNSYESGTSLEDAERLAAKCLYGQLQVSSALKAVDLDARMRKSGLKAVKAAVYLSEVKGADKKPTEAQLTALIDSNELVSNEQDAYDKAESERDELQRYYDVFLNAHIYYRGVSKGRFE